MLVHQRVVRILTMNLDILDQLGQFLEEDVFMD